MTEDKNNRSNFDLEKKNAYTISILFGISLFFFLLSRIIPDISNSQLIFEMKEASNLMTHALEALGECRLKQYRGSETSPNDYTAREAILGIEMSSITTSLGSLASKKTSADPNFAGLVVFLLHKIGVKSHENIAVGASSSFPALIIATLAAARIMEVRPIWICSLGASQWGANDPDFHWLHMWTCLKDKKIFSVDPVAVSLGGEEDTGGGMGAEGKEVLLKAIGGTRLPFINEPILERNVARRMQFYEQAAAEKDIRVFINIGGSYANIGTDPEILNLHPGLVTPENIPQPEKRGVLFEMANRGVTIIHLLYIKGLSSRYGISWNPDVLPRAGESKLYELAAEKSWIFLGIGILYLVITLSVMIWMIVIKRRYWSRS